MKAILRDIKEAEKLPATSENLNYLGDLYLKINDRNAAINSYYAAAEKLNFSQKDKKIALFKKILRLSTSQEKAYEELIFIFSKMGLVAEEKRYLQQLIRLYQERAEYNKIDAIFRRILEIDPADRLAAAFFEKGKDEGEPDRYELDDAPDISQFDSVRAPLLPPNALTAEADAKPENYGKSRPELHSSEKPALSHAGEDYEAVSSEDTAAGPHPAAVPGRFPSLLLPAIIAVLVVVVFFALYDRRMKSITQDVAVRTASAITPIRTTIGEYDISLEPVDEEDLSARVSEAEKRRLTFFRLSVGNNRRCLPESFIAEPHAMVSVIAGDGKPATISRLAGIEELSRVIYRSNACGRASAPVFLGMVIALETDKTYRKMLIGPLRAEETITLSFQDQKRP